MTETKPVMAKRLYEALHHLTSYSMGQTTNSRILPSRMTLIQANEDIVWQLLQLLASQPVSSISQLLIPLSLLLLVPLLERPTQQAHQLFLR